LGVLFRVPTQETYVQAYRKRRAEGGACVQQGVPYATEPTRINTYTV